MNFIVFPSETLCNAKSSPFILPKKLQGAFSRIVVIFGNGLEHGLGELDVTVLIFAVRVSGGVMDRVNELLNASPFGIRERSRCLVSAGDINVHGGHFQGRRLFLFLLLLLCRSLVGWEVVELLLELLSSLQFSLIQTGEERGDEELFSESRELGSRSRSGFWVLVLGSVAGVGGW